MKPVADDKASPQGGIFYGWFIVASVFFTTASAAGTIYAFPAFFSSFSQEFGANRFEISLVFAISECVWFSSGFGAGFLADRIGPRLVVLGGSVLMAGGLALAASASSIEMLYVAYGLGVGIGGGSMYVPSVGVIQRWFKRRRGLASGLAICGTGIGTLVVPFLTTLMIGSLGWRNTHYVLALGIIAVCGTASLVLVTGPGVLGLAPDGDPHPPADASQPPPGATLREALSTPAFWFLYFASLVSSASVFITYAHLVPNALDNGISAQSSITLVGALGIAGTFGRFLLGGIADHVGRRHALTLMFAGLAAAMAWWLLAPPTFLALLIYAVSFGAFYGGYITVLPVLAMDFYGGRRISTIIGCLYTSWAFGALGGPPLAGFLYEASGNYFYAILTGGLFMVLATVSCLLVREPQQQY